MGTTKKTQVGHAACTTCMPRQRPGPSEALATEATSRERPSSCAISAAPRRWTEQHWRPRRSTWVWGEDSRGTKCCCCKAQYQQRGARKGDINALEPQSFHSCTPVHQMRLDAATADWAAGRSGKLRNPHPQALNRRGKIAFCECFGWKKSKPPSGYSVDEGGPGGRTLRCRKVGGRDVGTTGAGPRGHINVVPAYA